MAFSGTFEAPKITPSAFGLLAVVKPENDIAEDKWVRGFAQEWETTPEAVTNYDATDTTSSSIATATPIYYDEIDPFFIEVDETLSTFSFNSIDRIARIKRQLEGVTQKAIEAELWDGAIRIGESHANKALTDPAATILNSGTALSPRRALALLEHTIATTSPAGEQGIIHMTRDMAALLASNSQMLFHEKGMEHLQTLGGTPVIVGSGYSGAGPTDAADSTETPSATNKWMYATGKVKVFLGNPDVVNDSIAQGYAVSGNQNDVRLKAIRPAAVYFDTSIHLAVRVDLTA
jgi:hypothetical protein